MNGISDPLEILFLHKSFFNNQLEILSHVVVRGSRSIAQVFKLTCSIFFTQHVINGNVVYCGQW